VAVVGIAGFGCLYWSGSKAGWLLMLLLGLVGLLHLPFGKHFKLALIAGVLLLGLGGFFWKYSIFFQKGATSVSARFDYWRAAIQTTAQRPIFGTGPGTFQIAYQRVKRPESEPSRLTHNDYLEQASDSGLPGLLIYGVFIVGALCWGNPKEIQRKSEIRSPRLEGQSSESKAESPVAQARSSGSARSSDGQRTELEICAPRQDWTTFWVWVGVLGWALQGLVEFGLYIPALAWPAFALLGWLLGRNRG
jgi:O-antigen ligase